MIFEKYNLSIDVEKLKNQLIEEVVPHEATYQSPAFGGWSVLSSNGSMKDGWQRGFVGMKDNMTAEEFKNLRSQHNLKASAEYVVPTEICTGYIQEVIEKIRALKLEPRRARIIKLPARLESVWHRDSPENLCAVRLHVPIVTNPLCYFETETERAHLPADGSAYFLFVNRMHRVINGGDTDRYHMVMDVRDTQGITQFHRWYPPQPSHVLPPMEKR